MRRCLRCRQIGEGEGEFSACAGNAENAGYEADLSHRVTGLTI